jgi:hypothetical protein
VASEEWLRSWGVIYLCVGYFITLCLDCIASNGEVTDELEEFGRKLSCPEQDTIQHLPGGNEECHGKFPAYY